MIIGSAPLALCCQMNKKYIFLGKLVKGFGTEKVGRFFVHLENFMAIWYIL
jgi:hypothetical protein